MPFYSLIFELSTLAVIQFRFSFILCPKPFRRGFFGALFTNPASVFENSVDFDGLSTIRISEGDRLRITDFAQSSSTRRGLIGVPKTIPKSTWPIMARGHPYRYLMLRRSPWACSTRHLERPYSVLQLCGAPSFAFFLTCSHRIPVSFTITDVCPSISCLALSAIV